MKKKFLLAVSSIILVLSLVGCNSEERQAFDFDPNNISSIEIETGAAPVSIVKSTGNTVEVSYTQDVATLQNGVLKVDVPWPNPGINLKDPEALTISIPDQSELAIQIKSESGDITIENVPTPKLVVNAQYGKISLISMEGHVMAKSELSTIKTNLKIASEIKSLGDVGQELNVQLGDSENEISLTTNTGTIELK